jgi:hypothetical protein
VFGRRGREEAPDGTGRDESWSYNALDGVYETVMMGLPDPFEDGSKVFSKVRRTEGASIDGHP